MKKMIKKNFLLLFLIICFVILVSMEIMHILSTFYISNSVYETHRYLTEKLILSAENGISHYLSHIQNDLLNMSQKKEIEYFGEEGRNYIKIFQSDNKDIYKNLTRIDKQGKLIYTFPEDEKSIGRDVLYQEHNKKLFKEKVSVISRPFLAVQGYKAIAISVPVFQKEEFDGCIACLIPFDRIWEFYVQNIKPTENSFVIVANKDGGIIYSPEYMFQYDNINQMMDIFWYNDSLTFDTISNYSLSKVSVIKDVNKNLKSNRFSLVKSSFKIKDNVWYLLVFTPDNEIKKIYHLVFRSQTIFAYLIIFLILFTGIFFVWILSHKIKEKDKLVQQIFEEKHLSEREKEFFENIIKSIVKVKGLFLFVLKGDGEIVFHNQQNLEAKNIYDIIESEKKHRVKESLDFIYEKNRVTAMMIELKLTEKFSKILFNISSFSFQNEKFIVLTGFEYEKMNDINIISDIFADSFKRWFSHEKMLCFIDSSGKILVSNRTFQIRFNNPGFLNELQSKESVVMIERAITEIYENVNEVTIDFQNKNGFYRMTLIPIINEFLKVEFVSVEII